MDFLSLYELKVCAQLEDISTFLSFFLYFLLFHQFVTFLRYSDKKKI